MKKILLFLFVMILTTIKINAEVLPTEYEIEFHQSPLNYEKADIKGTRIDSTLYQVFYVDFYGEHYVDAFSDSYNVYFESESDARFHLVETGQSEGFYENIPLDIFFNLNKTCPKIIVDVKKKVKESTYSITNKTDNPTYYYLYNGAGELVTKNLLFGGTNNFVLPYDNYRFKTGFGDITMISKPSGYLLKTLVYESDSLSIHSSEIEIETPYNLDVTITKQCIDDEGDFYNVPVDIDVEEDTYDNETFNQDSSEIDIHNVQLDTTEDEGLDETDDHSEIDIKESKEEDLKDEIVITPIINNDHLIIPNEKLPVEITPIIEDNQLVVVNDPININNKIIKEKVPIVEEATYDNNVIEDLESNLIIEKTVSEEAKSKEKTKIKKASNIPVIIIGLLPFFLILVVKIIKKVQKI